MSSSSLARALDLSCHPVPSVAVTALTAGLAALANLPLGRAVLVTAAVFTGQLSIGWSNDYLDAERDRAVRRSDKPVASGAMAPRVAGTAAGVALILTLALSASLSWPGGVEREELGVGMRTAPARSGQHGSEERDPAADEDRGPASAGQEVLGVVQTSAPLVEDAQAQDGRAHLASYLITDTVADDRRDDDDRDHGSQGGVVEAGGNTAQDGRSLAGNHEPDEEGVLDQDDVPSRWPGTRNLELSHLSL